MSGVAYQPHQFDAFLPVNHLTILTQFDAETPEEWAQIIRRRFNLVKCWVWPPSCCSPCASDRPRNTCKDPEMLLSIFSDEDIHHLLPTRDHTIDLYHSFSEDVGELATSTNIIVAAFTTCCMTTVLAPSIEDHLLSQLLNLIVQSANHEYKVLRPTQYQILGWIIQRYIQGIYRGIPRL